MSLNWKEGRELCQEGKKVVYLTDKPTKDGVDTMKLTGDKTFTPSIYKATERTVGMISAASGSGKSFYVKMYCEAYHKMWPKRPIYVFSSLASCQTLDKLSYLKRVKISTPEFMGTEFNADDFKESLVVFDDIDVMSNKKIRDKVITVLNTLLQTGRHAEASVLYTTHLATNGHMTKLILAECHFLTFFSKNMPQKSLKYLLENYLGYDPKEIEYIKKLEGRWCTAVKSYPACCFSEKEVLVKGSFPA